MRTQHRTNRRLQLLSSHLELVLSPLETRSSHFEIVALVALAADRATELFLMATNQHRTLVRPRHRRLRPRVLPVDSGEPGLHPWKDLASFDQQLDTSMID